MVVFSILPKRDPDGFLPVRGVMLMPAEKTHVALPEALYRFRKCGALIRREAVPSDGMPAAMLHGECQRTVPVFMLTEIILVHQPVNRSVIALKS